jgi:crotonobetainyl-CoA:carnitine CoA-transferase CaiB-like acyl-CoA transferase
MIADLKILELASVLAGPSVGQFFAELGAEVIKVENLPGGGDVTRTWKLPGEQTDDRSAYFCSTNWGKKSVAIDLLKEEGKELICQLAKTSDIIIVSYKPGDAEKLGVDYKTLSRMNPRLIYGQVTGYGMESNRVGYDAVIQAESGFMFINGEPGGHSLKMPVALMDILAGHQLKEGLLVALLDRAKTDTGRLVSVSIMQAAIASLANQASNWLVAGHNPEKQGSIHPNIAPYGEVFQTHDRAEILIAVGTDKQFYSLCNVLEAPELNDDPGFSSNTLRVRNRVRLRNELQRMFQVRNSKDLIRELHLAKIPAGLIQSVDQVLNRPEAKELIMQSGSLQGIQTFVARNSRQLAPPPHFGEHTELVLSERLGYSAESLKRLQAARII